MFVMDAWGKDLCIKNVKLIPDVMWRSETIRNVSR